MSAEYIVALRLAVPVQGEGTTGQIPLPIVQQSIDAIYESAREALQDRFPVGDITRLNWATLEVWFQPPE